MVWQVSVTPERKLIPKVGEFRLKKKPICRAISTHEISKRSEYAQQILTGYRNIASEQSEWRVLAVILKFFK